MHECFTLHSKCEFDKLISLFKKKKKIRINSNNESGITLKSLNQIDTRNKKK
jgi:hypothetical protein